MRIFGVSLFIVLVMACSTDKLNEITMNSDNSSITYSVDQDSMKQGLYLEISKEGDTLDMAYYKNDKLDGKRYVYAKQGYVQIEETYKEGQFHGPIINYYPDGTPETKGNFTNGQLDSIFYAYYPSGAVREKVHIEDNIENGPFEEYYESGGVHWKGTFINGGNEVGLLQEFDEDGTLIKKMDCGEYKGEYICQTIWTLEGGDVQPTLQYD